MTTDTLTATSPAAETPAKELHEGSLPSQAIGRVLNTQQVANIEFSPKGGVTIHMVSAPGHIMDKTAITGFSVPPQGQVEPGRLTAQLDALSKEGLLGPAAKELAERAKQAVEQGPNADNPLGHQTVTLQTPATTSQTASTLAPQPAAGQQPIMVSPEIQAAAQAALATPPAQQAVMAEAGAHPTAPPATPHPVIGAHTANLAASQQGPARQL
ncbi:MAG: hypothetical protein K2Q12_04375 [Rickettsiales bacterium]|nr:hypothetical protein [Rickettsiales bacterium]